MLDEWNGIYVKSNDEIVTLSQNEMYVLEYLIEHKDRVCSTKELTETIYGKGTFFKKYKGLNNIIARLRNKLAGDLAIVNNRTIGFRVEYIGRRLENDKEIL